VVQVVPKVDKVELTVRIIGMLHLHLVQARVNEPPHRPPSLWPLMKEEDYEAEVDVRECGYHPPDPLEVVGLEVIEGKDEDCAGSDPSDGIVSLQESSSNIKWAEDTHLDF